MLRSIALVLLLAACGSSSDENFDNFQACFNEHTTKESFSPACAIEICCIDHGIGGQKPDVVCGDTADTCSSYVTAHLMDSADTNLTTDITNACGFYIVDSGRGSGSSSGCGS
jgi:hypothetical protein